LPANGSLTLQVRRRPWLRDAIASVHSRSSDEKLSPLYIRGIELVDAVGRTATIRERPTLWAVLRPAVGWILGSPNLDEKSRETRSLAIPRPRPSILDDMVRLSRSGEARWRSPDGKRYFTWDSLHGEVEVFDSRGWHLGAIDPISGNLVSQPVRGRKLEL